MKLKPKFTRRLRAEIRMPVTDMRIGMFVSKLDCGWHNTPFMLEGLLIRNDNEISTLAKFAREVIVDPRRSQLKSFHGHYLARIYEDTPKSGTVFTKNAPSPAPKKIVQQTVSREKQPSDRRSPPAKAASQNASFSTPDMNATASAGIGRLIATETDVRFKEYMFSMYAPQAANMRGINLFQSFSAWLSSLAGFSNQKIGRSRKIRPLPPGAKPSYIPSDTQLVIYPEPEPTYVSLSQARMACDHVEETLKRILDDISMCGISNVETLREAADTVVDNMIARYQQALSVAIHLTALGRQIGFQREQLADLAGVGLLLDVGKVTIDAALLNKPGRLTPPEIEIIRTHVQQGLKMFGESGNLPDVMTRAIAEHHERVDGTGYPNGLNGKDISIFGKMAAIADSFVAMVNPRPYAPTYTGYDAIRQLFRESDCRWFRPLVEQFVQSIGIFPVGSLVELSTGEVAIIVQHNRIRRMEPKVLVVTGPGKSLLDRPWDLDMLRHNQNAINTEIRILKAVADGAYGIDFRSYYSNMK